VDKALKKHKTNIKCSEINAFKDVLNSDEVRNETLDKGKRLTEIFDPQSQTIEEFCVHRNVPDMMLP